MKKSTLNIKISAFDGYTREGILALLRESLEETLYTIRIDEDNFIVDSETLEDFIPEQMQMCDEKKAIFLKDFVEKTLGYKVIAGDLYLLETELEKLLKKILNLNYKTEKIIRLSFYLSYIHHQNEISVYILIKN